MARHIRKKVKNAKNLKNTKTKATPSILTPEKLEKDFTTLCVTLPRRFRDALKTLKKESIQLHAQLKKVLAQQKDNAMQLKQKSNNKSLITAKKAYHQKIRELTNSIKKMEKRMAILSSKLAKFSLLKKYITQLATLKKINPAEKSEKKTDTIKLDNLKKEKKQKTLADKKKLKNQDAIQKMQENDQQSEQEQSLSERNSEKEVELDFENN